MANYEDKPLTSFSLTHVYYDPADSISFICAWLALVPQGLCVVYASLIWATREAEILLMFAGQMGCEALNWILKRVIKEERPRQIHGKGYGMPSSHAQFVAFFSVYLTLFLLVRHTPSAPSSSPRTTSMPHTPLSLTHRVTLSLLALLSAAAVAASRIYLSYHTPRQVLAGCGVGGIIAVSWFVVVEVARRTGWVEWALQSGVGRALRMRDLCLTEDLMEAGWVRWEELRLEKERKGVSGVGVGANGGKKKKR